MVSANLSSLYRIGPLQKSLKYLGTRGAEEQVVRQRKDKRERIVGMSAKALLSILTVFFLLRDGAKGETVTSNLPPWGVTVRVGTLGVGGDLVVRLGSYFNLRGGITYAIYETELSLDEADVAARFRWLTIPILLDCHPGAGDFRVSAGLVVNRNRISLSATPTQPIELDGIAFDIVTLNGKITFRDLAPYVGIGTGNAVYGNSRVRFACDFGVLFHGPPDVTAEALATHSSYQQALNVALQNEVDELETKIKGLQYYPVLSLGLSLRF